MRGKRTVLGLESTWYSESSPIAPEFVQFAETHLLPLVTLTGYKQDRKRETAVRCLHCLALAELRDPPKLVQDNRDNSRNSLRVSVWDALIAAGLCRIWSKGIAGFAGRIDGHVTRYRATRKLLRLLAQHQSGRYVGLTLARNTERAEPTADAYIVLHTGKRDIATGKLLPVQDQKKLLPLPTEYLGYLRREEDRIIFCNMVMAQHTWKIPAKLTYEPCFLLKQTHSGQLGRYTRLSGLTPISIQSLSERERATILIDHEPATELDYGQFDIRIRYHSARMDPKGDAYRPNRIFPAFYASGYASKKGKETVRKFVKTITNVCLNCESAKQAGLAIGQILREWPQRPQHFLWGWEGERAFLYRVLTEIEGIDGPNPARIVSRILHAHKRIRHLFFTQAPFWMSTGTAIDKDIWYQFAKADKPVYLIHDSVLCRRSDRQFAEQTMQAMYRRWAPFGFDPQINVKF